ncbi:glycosyltransferase family 4 protein [Dietzia psychralcaliphila]|uniref:Alpha-(1-2)-phosphatidylinositol mannosyltransferase n=1 Tax=Dietzia psychralcaliphila TaxID=139021 RepID=A0AAD0NR09_9ACTN|nr:glycosyltransferase family 4 protein [Dietzia psychralcaliphila]AWH95593.1 alpha-(1-2)-phosphatidylinositol mannosyltransferase [Dietzia psychralcaliphila]PTM88654.1 phosphatidylinositol alpha-mannosyltransferase [Dietzia psychralcaliphila]
MRIGMICPYSFDAPGGVQAHVVDLTEELRRRGHTVRVLAPGRPGSAPVSGMTLTGPGVPIPYNGSVARLSFGPAAWRATRHWLRREPLDVLHIHEPNAPGVGMFALAMSSGPITATFHTSTSSSMILGAADGALAPLLEKIRGRIAVSTLARRWQMEALGSGAVEIPNGVDVAAFRDVDATAERSDSPTVAFLGRYDEPRKGMDVLVAALPDVLRTVPDLRLRIMGDGDERALRARMPPGLDVEFLGRVDDRRKAAVLAAADVYCAPNTGGESFGIVLVEAMAAGAAVVASDLDAFRRVLDDGACGELSAVGDPGALAAALVRVLGDDAYRAGLCERASEAVREFDWPVVAERVIRVYETVRGPGETLRVR